MFCDSSKVALFSLLTIDDDMYLNMSENLNQIYSGRSVDMNIRLFHILEAIYTLVAGFKARLRIKYIGRVFLE